MLKIFNKIGRSNETFNQFPQTVNGKPPYKGYSLYNIFEHINPELKPKNISQDEIQFKYFVKIKAYINPVEFMNLLGNIITKKYGEDKCYIEGDKKNIKLNLFFGERDNKISIILFKSEEANDEYYIQFIRQECNIRDFYSYFSVIKEIIRGLIV